MSAITRLSSQPPASPYAPGSASTRISEVTVAAVDRIGNETSDQIRKTADALEADAKKIGDKLRELAAAFDDQTRIASEKISGFCMRMSSARAMVMGLEGEIKGGIDPSQSVVPDDGQPSPKFLHQPIN